MRTQKEIERGLGCCVQSFASTVACHKCPYEISCFTAMPRKAMLIDVHKWIRQLDTQIPKWVNAEGPLPGDPEDTVGETVNVVLDKSGVICTASAYYNWQAKQWYIYDGTNEAYRASLYGHVVIAWAPLPEFVEGSYA